MTPLRSLAVVATATAALSACGGSSTGETSGDCEVLVRLGGTTYRAVALDGAPPASTLTPILPAEVSDCDDQGPSTGVSFDGEGEHADAFTVAGYDPDEVVVVRSGVVWHLALDTRLDAERARRVEQQALTALADP